MLGDLPSPNERTRVGFGLRPVNILDRQQNGAVRRDLDERLPIGVWMGRAIEQIKLYLQSAGGVLSTASPGSRCESED